MCVFHVCVLHVCVDMGIEDDGRTNTGHMLNANYVGCTQRPRKLVIFGSDGKEYTYLLKGHEDLRQDERATQVCIVCVVCVCVCLFDC